MHMIPCRIPGSNISIGEHHEQHWRLSLNKSTYDIRVIAALPQLTRGIIWRQLAG